ncbi:hypothetical protein EG328_002346 [Venturia inaequalis]|uniref:Uncharacterized protein n=1 Tax=Venturia inaequalis TaxID=5025 RepID=A0A8H3Z1W6_VENIN|nr:hypothetical protein EG328_002346 [Venturia inaequalis]RDI82850.1 hypothetical protein Vi05172_g7130 [Venturia inaequalis]
MSSENLPHPAPTSDGDDHGKPTSPRGRPTLKSRATSFARKIDPRRRSTANANGESLSKAITIDRDTFPQTSTQPANEEYEVISNSPSAPTSQYIHTVTEHSNALSRAQTDHLLQPPQEHRQFMFPIVSEDTMSPKIAWMYRDRVRAIEGRLTAVGPHVRPEYNRMIAETIVGSLNELEGELWDAVGQRIERARSGQNQNEQDPSGPSALSAQKATVTQPLMSSHAHVRAPAQDEADFEYPTILRGQLSEERDGMYRHKVQQLADQLTTAGTRGSRQYAHLLAEEFAGLHQGLRINVRSSKENRASEKADFETKWNALDSDMKASCQEGQNELYKALCRKIEDSRCHCRGSDTERATFLSETTTDILSGLDGGPEADLRIQPVSDAEAEAAPQAAMDPRYKAGVVNTGFSEDEAIESETTSRIAPEAPPTITDMSPRPSSVGSPGTSNLIGFFEEHSRTRNSNVESSAEPSRTKKPQKSVVGMEGKYKTEGTAK